jgi:hypothetical protein
MRTKSILALFALVVFSVVGVTWASVPSQAKTSCCYPGSECCFPGSPCCEDCCFPGSECCFPGSPCCLSTDKVKATCCDGSCCPDGPCCPGPCCTVARKSCCEE